MEKSAHSSLRFCPRSGESILISCSKGKRFIDLFYKLTFLSFPSSFVCYTSSRPYSARFNLTWMFRFICPSTLFIYMFLLFPPLILKPQPSRRNLSVQRKILNWELHFMPVCLHQPVVIKVFRLREIVPNSVLVRIN